MADFYMDKARAEQRAERILTAELNRQLLAEPSVATGDGEGFAQAHGTLPRRLFISVTLIILVFVLLLTVNPAQAQLFEPGDGEPFHDTMLPFTLGNYYFLKGEYDKAVDYFTEAVESLPVEVYEFDPTFANLYRYLGDAQYAAGLEDDALESYALYVEYAGDEARLEETVLAFVESNH